MEKYILSVADLIRQFVDAKDEKVIEELIKMGWTPPEDAAVIAARKKREDACKYHPPIEEGINITATESMMRAAEKERDEIDDLLEESVQQKVKAKQPIATFPYPGGTVSIFAGRLPPLEEPPVNKTIHEAFRTMTHAVHANAVEHGWFDTEMPNKEMEFLIGMAGVMKECGEALEVVSAKEWDVMDEKCPQHTKLVVELADVVLRLLTLCGRHDLNIGAAITAKHEFNRSRPYRHGGKAF